MAGRWQYEPSVPGVSVLNLSYQFWVIRNIYYFLVTARRNPVGSNWESNDENDESSESNTAVQYSSVYAANMNVYL